MCFLRDEIRTEYDALMQFYDSLDTAGVRAGTLLELPGYAVGRRSTLL
jgi:hypothetical protein